MLVEALHPGVDSLTPLVNIRRPTGVGDSRSNHEWPPPPEVDPEGESRGGEDMSRG